MAERIDQAEGADTRVLLIGGAMRSGTTIIHRALCTAENSNPYLSESWFLHDIMRLYKTSLPRYQLRLADQFGSKRNFRELIRINVQYYLRMVSARHGDPDLLVLKHPEFSKLFVDFGAMFPSMQFLAIVRDPRDVLSSIKGIRDAHRRDGVAGPLTRLKSVEDMCNYYAAYYAGLMRSGGRLGDRLKFVRYEDVMRDPKGKIAEIGAFCGGRYDLEEAKVFDEAKSRSSNLDKDFRLKDPVSAAFWSDLYRKDLSSERIGRFAEALDPAEIAEIETRLAPIGRKFGYWGVDQVSPVSRSASSKPAKAK